MGMENSVLGVVQIPLAQWKQRATVLGVGAFRWLSRDRREGYFPISLTLGLQ
jgi:hypothetical protein